MSLLKHKPSLTSSLQGQNPWLWAHSFHPLWCCLLPAFFCYTVIIILISFHNWANLHTQRLPGWLSITHHILFWAPISTSVSSMTPYLTSPVVSPLMHSIPPTFPVPLIKPEGTSRPLSVVSTMPESHFHPFLTSPSHYFSSVRRPIPRKWYQSENPALPVPFA